MTACGRRSADFPTTGTRKYPENWPTVVGLLYCAFLARQGQAACRRWLPGHKVYLDGLGNLEISFVYLHICKLSSNVRKILDTTCFIDESGDFGPYDFRSPYYYVAMVLHDQSEDISEKISVMESRAANNGYPNHAIHTGPLIRRENV